ncbi:MAG TPA: alkaline phosphatase family protein [Actinomycetota bacterium]|nr:alkaline phosphatase family protein [Actinomycetota bacterium]
MHRVTRIGVAVMLAAAVAAAGCTKDTGGEPPPGTSGYPPPRFTPSPVPNVDEPAGSWLEASCELDPEIFTRVMHGYYPHRAPDVLAVPRTPDFFGGFVQTSHSGPWDYLAQVPIVFYGPGFIRPVGHIAGDRVTLADIAPTFAELLGVDSPNDRGHALDRVLEPESRRGDLRLIVTVVWDGGGTNVLNAWPDYWPNLKKIMERGATLDGATIGSSPSVTPATHTTIGTGTFPDEHGITGITIQQPDGSYIDSFAGRDADAVEVPMLGDTYDLATGNAAKIGLFAYKSWHLGMMSHGANWPGGDHDLAAFLDTNEKFATNPNLYYMPNYLDSIPGLHRELRKVDLEDGKLDDVWMGHDILANHRYRRDTPAWVLHQTDVLKVMMKREGFGADDVPDLFFTNYKQIDEGGHDWNMVNPEVAELVKYSDAALPQLVDFLNKDVGKRHWVMVLTADHGQQPDAQMAQGWPISTTELIADAAKHFGLPARRGIFGSAAGLWLNQEMAAAKGVTKEDLADWLIDYRISDNIPAGREDSVPDQYDDRMDEPVIAAAFPADQAARVRSCLGANP